MKKIFSYNGDINKTAYLNWRTDRHDAIQNLIVIANGYMEGAITLAKDLLKNNYSKRADIVAFPMLFNANHAIELYLKSIEWSLNILLKNGMKADGNHDIVQILNIVKSRVDEFEDDKNKKKQFKKLIAGLDEYINELNEILYNEKTHSKDKMDFSRYPYNNKYKNHFYVDQLDNVTVDIENFIIRFSEIGENLKCISEYYLYDFVKVSE